MKKLIYILIIAASLIGFSSCEGNLDPEVYNRLSPTNYPETEEDYMTLVNNIYGQFRYDNAWYRYSCDPQSRLILGEIGTDELYMPWEWAQRPQSAFDFNPGYDLFHNFYTRMVPSVTKATYTLALIEESDLEEQMKNRLMSEVICCRAQWLYDLGSFYGPPPVVLDKEKAKNPKELYFPPRLSEEDYLAFVEEDIKYAMKYLPVKYESSADYGRYTKGAAASILMKMYMQHKRFADAVSISDSIMTCGYGLVGEYSKIWDINNEKNEESIFVLTAPSKAHVNANIYRAHVLPSDWVSLSGAKVVAYDGYRIPWTIYDKFDKEDKRLSTLIKDYYIMKNKIPTLVDGRKTGRLRNGAIPLKYGEDPASDGLFCGTDIVLIRYADILLLRAEALNEINGPNQESIDLINQIRDRAFNNNPAKKVNLSMFADKQSLNDYILQERQFELLFEGERRADLIRHDKYIQQAQDRGVTNAQPHHVRYPLPSFIIIEGQGNIKQNYGYN
ncbi:MAG: RagB/SusD family nutrient uptake outer membrane protein [Paludibacter sp.]|jgi:hypothetical protein|nr:RagB/SusD family nutrient uptake outer membrane protein [Paludibacter sp.]